MARYWRRRYHHYPHAYWPLHQPTITGVVVGAVVGFLGSLIGAAYGVAWRYRSELAPLAVAAMTRWSAGWAHTHHPGWWAPVAGLTATAVAALAACPRRWQRVRWPVLGRETERAYLGVCVAIGGGWSAAAIRIGADTPPLPVLAIVGTVACAVPWWAHHRRRAKVRVERALEAWPDVAEAAGLAGSRVASAVVDAWGWTARIALPRGHTANQVIATVAAIESGLGIAPGAARAEPDPHRADRAYLRVLDRDPHAHPIPYPRPAPGTASITRPVPLGLWDNGTVTSVLLLRRNTIIGGITDSGKSNIVNVVLAYLAACPDVVIWGIDLKGGMELGPWAPCIARLATTPQHAITLLADAVTEIDIRAHEQSDRGERLWNPDYDRPAILIVIDEYAELPDEATKLADSIARRGRAVAVNLLLATQRPTQKAMRHNAVRSQMDVRICLRVRERRDVTLILVEGMLAAGWNAHQLGAAGKFLISAREPQFSTPRPARAYLITDTDVAAVVRDHRRYETTATGPVDESHTDTTVTTNPATGTTDTAADIAAGPATEDPPSAEQLLWAALIQASEEGIAIGELITITGKSRSWVYERLQEHTKASRAVRTARGYWRANPPTTP